MLILPDEDLHNTEIQYTNTLASPDPDPDEVPENMQQNTNTLTTTSTVVAPNATPSQQYTTTSTSSAGLQYSSLNGPNNKFLFTDAAGDIKFHEFALVSNDLRTQINNLNNLFHRALRQTHHNQEISDLYIDFKKNLSEISNIAEARNNLNIPSRSHYVSKDAELNLKQTSNVLLSNLTQTLTNAGSNTMLIKKTNDSFQTLNFNNSTNISTTNNAINAIPSKNITQTYVTDQRKQTPEIKHFVKEFMVFDGKHYKLLTSFEHNLGGLPSFVSVDLERTNPPQSNHSNVGANRIHINNNMDGDHEHRRQGMTLKYDGKKVHVICGWQGNKKAWKGLGFFCEETNGSFKGANYANFRVIVKAYRFVLPGK